MKKEIRRDTYEYGFSDLEGKPRWDVSSKVLKEMKVRVL